MAHEITVYIDQDYSTLGEAATQADLDQYAENLATHLSAKFGRDVSVDTCLGGRNGSVGLHYRRTLTNEELDAHEELDEYVRELEAGDGWIDLLGDAADPAPAQTAERTYTYTIYDADPAMSGSCAWPSHDDVEMSAESPEEALAAALSEAESGGDTCGEYETGDVLYVLVWDQDGQIAASGTYTVNTDDEEDPAPSEECGIDSGDIRKLRAEAASARDFDMVALCDQALSANDEDSTFAYEECRRVIAHARAQENS